jgi:hypothetical protein
MTKTGPWSADETALLRRYAREGRTVTAAATALGRPKGACTAKAMREGLSFSGGRGDYLLRRIKQRTARVQP